MEESYQSGLSDLGLLVTSNQHLSYELQRTKKHIRHIMKLGLAFTLIIFFPMSGCLQETILKSYEEKTGDTINAYLCQSIQCISGALACLYTPVLLAYFQAKPAFVIAGTIHVFYIGSYIYPNTLALYTISAFVGAGASLIWMTHGITVIHNSTDETLARNYSLFFVIFQISFLISNAYIYISYGSIDNYITETMLILLGGGCLGLTMLPFISVPSTRGGTLATPVQMIRAVPTIVCNNKFVYMVPLCVYLGLETCFIFGPFPSAISSMKMLGDHPHQLVGLIGLVMSCGKIFYGLCAMRFNENTSVMVILGMISHLIAYYISFIYIPSDAILHDTYAVAYLTPNLAVLCIASFLLGVGDVCVYTTGFSLLGKIFRGPTAGTAISVFNFIILLFTGIHFFLSSFISMQIQLVIIVVCLIFAVLGVFKVDNLIREKEAEDDLEPSE